ncbi:MAG: hypothetical protein N3A62_00240 [Thermodesulfovibrionales bacterium]|nr:hypothetical protein [Thermodesulfovibrionales bacterium]
MKRYIWFLYLLIIIVVQEQITIFDNQLNFTAALVFIHAIKNIPKNPHIKGYWSGRGEIDSAVFGAIVGGFEDVLSHTILGPSLLGKSIMGWATAFVFSDIIYKWTPILIAFVLSAFTILDSFLMITARLMLTDIVVSHLKILEGLILQAVVNMPIGLFIKSPRDL